MEECKSQREAAPGGGPAVPVDLKRGREPVHIGVIGTGNMGSILVEAFIESRAAIPEEVVVMNRTKAKAEALRSRVPGIAVADTADEVVRRSNLTFLCVRPTEMPGLLRRIGGSVAEEDIIVSITSPVGPDDIEASVSGKGVRWIPSITNRALAGATLLTYGSRINAEDKQTLRRLASHFSTPIEIPDDVTRVASDLASAGPAFIGFLLEQMIRAATEETAISEELAVALTTEMMVGFGALLKRQIYTLETLRQKVQVQGGVTGVGLNVLERETGAMFHHLFRKTQEKFKEDREAVKRGFDGQA